jgi:hypothetical protein
MIQEQNSGEKSKYEEKKVQETEIEEQSQLMRRPVFLNRNRRKMKQLRKHLIDSTTLNGVEGELVLTNGLVIRQVPSIRKLQFDANT